MTNQTISATEYDAQLAAENQRLAEDVAASFEALYRGEMFADGDGDFHIFHEWDSDNGEPPEDWEHVGWDDWFESEVLEWDWVLDGGSHEFESVQLCLNSCPKVWADTGLRFVRVTDNGAEPIMLSLDGLACEEANDYWASLWAAERDC